jgi:hypothetical protein
MERGHTIFIKTIGENYDQWLKIFIKTSRIKNFRTDRRKFKKKASNNKY